MEDSDAIAVEDISDGDSWAKVRGGVVQVAKPRPNTGWIKIGMAEVTDDHTRWATVGKFASDTC